MPKEENNQKTPTLSWEISELSDKDFKEVIMKMLQ